MSLLPVSRMSIGTVEDISACYGHLQTCRWPWLSVNIRNSRRARANNTLVCDCSTWNCLQLYIFIITLKFVKLELTGADVQLYSTPQLSHLCVCLLSSCISTLSSESTIITFGIYFRGFNNPYDELLPHREHIQNGPHQLFKLLVSVHYAII